MAPTHDVRCFIILSGLPRSLRWTERNILRHVILPFRSAAKQVSVVAHFNLPAVVDNPRSLEHSIPLPVPDLRAIAPDISMIERQSEGHVAAKLLAFRSHKLIGADDDRSKVNLLQSYYSLQSAWWLAERAGVEPGDVIIFIRPDLDYIDPWSPGELIARILDRGEDLICPSWHQFGGLNDRMAVASYSGAKLYTRRWDFVERIAEEGVPLSSEQILARCAAIESLDVGSFAARGLRVRADGRTLHEFDGPHGSLALKLRLKLRPWSNSLMLPRWATP